VPLMTLRAFLQREGAGGPLLVASAMLALVLANSPASSLYERLIALPFSVQLGVWGLSKPLLLWINDGLMAVFFLSVGLEVKREMQAGQLANIQTAALPVFAALGGIVVPVAIYVGFNRQGEALRGWAVPAATDIAFATGVLALLGGRVAKSLKIFLLTLAIIDDLGAIVIIAAFYTADLSIWALLLAAVAIATLGLLNLAGVVRTAPYILVGIFLWLCVLKSGVHATLAGVALAFTIPSRASATGESALDRLEHGLRPWVAFAILPLFAFANAGVPLANVSLASLLRPVPAGIALGLFLGKQIGVLAPTLAVIRLRPALALEGVTWPQLYGLSLLTGIGFTMSFFIGALAFEGGTHDVEMRLGVLVGSLLSAALGCGVLVLASPRSTEAAGEQRRVGQNTT
jgi:NhaA family Na+:H+ antiporter